MRFKRVELSPANKRQYLLALGVRDLELLMGVSKAATESMPVLPEYKTDRQRLHKITKGLAEAIEVAKADNDEGMRVPVAERAKYVQDREDNPLEDITRMEIIDHRKRKMCNGTAYVKTAIDSAAGQSIAFEKMCPECKGMGLKGRDVIFQSKYVRVTPSIQDDGHTMKLFLEDREPANLEDVVPQYDGNVQEFIEKFFELLKDK